MMKRFAKDMKTIEEFTPNGSVEEYLATASDHKFEGRSIEDIRKYISDGGVIYQDLRVQSETTGTMTYKVPVPESEIEYLFSKQNGNVQAFNVAGNNLDLPYTKIVDSGRPDKDSIVVILLSDGFAAEQYCACGTGEQCVICNTEAEGPNPAIGTIYDYVSKARSAIDAMLDTHPFCLFKDLFTVYAIHSVGEGHVVDINGNLGVIGGNGAFTQVESHLRTVRENGTLVPAAESIPRYPDIPGVDQERIRELADYRVDREHQTMIQVISNATDFGGFAWMPWYYTIHRNANIAVTSIRRGETPPGGSNTLGLWSAGTAWHGTFIHEFGHSFGKLVDEHATGRRGEEYANSTQAADDDIKWRHWGGYRNVEVTPSQRFNGWVVPAVVRPYYGQLSGCIMRGSWAYNKFCGVCRAELIRRMALISSETFRGRSPVTANPLPDTPIVAIPENAERILDSAFHGNTSLNTIHIPQSVATIGDYAFIGATGLRTIVNNSRIPQHINERTFAGLNRANIDVIVPPGSLPAYMSEGWHEFRVIENDITAAITDLAFNGTFNFSRIRLSGNSLFSGRQFFVEVIRGNL